MSARVATVTDCVTFARSSGARDALTTSVSDTLPIGSVTSQRDVTGPAAERDRLIGEAGSTNAKRERNARRAPRGDSARRTALVVAATTRSATTISTLASAIAPPETSRITAGNRHVSVERRRRARTARRPTSERSANQDVAEPKVAMTCCASSSEAAGSRREQEGDWNPGGRHEIPVAPFCSPQKVSR